MDNEILLEGIVTNDDDAWIFEWFGIKAFSPATLRTALKKANGGPVTVKINSPGGETWSGSVMYTELRSYPGQKTTQIIGLGASVASVIAMAGDAVQMAPTAEMMIHNPWMTASGDYRDMEHYADELRVSRETIINAYALKAKNLTRAEIGNMLNKETWFDAQTALNLGLIDSIMFDDGTLSGTAPAKSDDSEPMPGAKAAAANIPTAAALKERKRVWDELAPGAVNLEEAKARLSTATAPPASAEPEPPPTGPTEPPAPEPSAPDDSEIELLRAQIDVLAQF